MNSYVLSTDAEHDLNAIWTKDNIDAADKWISKLFDAFEAIERNPGIGHKREDITSHPVLFWPVGAYLVIYRAKQPFIEIVAVTQGSRDIPTFLNRRIHT